MRRSGPFALLFVLLTTTGCIAVSKLEHVPTATPVPPDRTDCGEILGSAFRSDGEMQWFTDHCSAWAQTTMGPVELPSQPAPAPSVEDSRQQRRGQGGSDGDDDDNERRGRGNREDGGQGENQGDNDEGDEGATDATQQQAPASDEERCNQMRGRPYENPDDRAWYLQTCLNIAGNPIAQAFSGEPPQCGQIRGRPYDSEGQRQWYLQNCLGQNDAQQVTGGPDRTNCDEIRGTPYRSIPERDWYRQNCG